MKQVTPTWATRVDRSRSNNNAVPEIATAPPTSAQARTPKRRYRRPAWDADMGQPIVSVASAKPATSGPVPRTSCTKVGI